MKYIFFKNVGMDKPCIGKKAIFLTKSSKKTTTICLN